MKRKRFLGSLLGAPLLTGLGIGTIKTKAGVFEEDNPFRLPPYLKTGDTIGITCPAGYMTLAELQPAVQTLKNWGFSLRIGSTVGARDFGFGGTDAQRLTDFQQMLDDPSIQAILCARGGYGFIRIIDGLNFNKFASRPKWILGFSDITVLHAHLSHHFRIASIHSKMCNSFPDHPELVERSQWDSVVSIKTALTGGRITYPILWDGSNRIGKGTGPLAGGNLKTIETLAGTTSDLKTNASILFLEDIGEYLYSVDRMFYNLKRTGKLDHLQGLLIGAFKTKQDDPGEEFGKSVYNIVLGHVKDYAYPVCFNFPVGHQKINYALKCGVRYELDIQPGTVNFNEVF
jgi:muramoyltetrapeptide carboxypeptidase